MSYAMTDEELRLQAEQDRIARLEQEAINNNQSVTSRIFQEFDDDVGGGASLDDYTKEQKLIEKLAAKKLKEPEHQAPTVGFSPKMGDGLGDLLVGAMLASIKKNVDYLFEKTRIFNEAQRVLGIDEDSPQYAQFKEFAKAHLKDFNFRKNDIYKPEVTGEMMARFSEQYPGLLSDEQKLAISRYNQDRGIEQKKEQSPSPSPQEVAKAAAALGITLNEAIPNEHKDLIEALKNGIDKGTLKGKDLEIANRLINTIERPGDMSTKIMAIQNAFDNLSPVAQKIVDINNKVDAKVEELRQEKIELTDDVKNGLGKSLLTQKNSDGTVNDFKEAHKQQEKISPNIGKLNGSEVAKNAETLTVDNTTNGPSNSRSPSLSGGN